MNSRIFSPSPQNTQVRMPIIIAVTLLLLLPPTAAGTPSTVPALPVAGAARNTSAACDLDLSAEMFGGVEDACGRGPDLDRRRCCPVLAAWLFAAHARSALRPRRPPPASLPADPLPMLPDTDSKICADALQTALAARNISLPRPNATCDAALCFCGIHLHEIGSLSCSVSFNASTAGEIRALEHDCRNASYTGCSRCLNSLQKLKGAGGGGERVTRMMDGDCRLMGLTWLLGRNKTAYIPTVSAVLRAILYSAHPPAPPYGCSFDEDNMPLAVDTLQFRRPATVRGASSVSRSAPWVAVYFVFAFTVSVAVQSGL